MPGFEIYWRCVLRRFWVSRFRFGVFGWALISDLGFKVKGRGLRIEFFCNPPCQRDKCGGICEHTYME